MTMTPFWREYLHHHNEHQGAITAISLSSYDDNILATAGEVTVIIIHQCEQIGRNNIGIEKKNPPPSLTQLNTISIPGPPPQPFGSNVPTLSCPLLPGSRALKY